MGISQLVPGEMYADPGGSLQGPCNLHFRRKRPIPRLQELARNSARLLPRPLSATWGFCTRRAGKLYKVRSRLYRSQILQVHTRWKDLAEIYTMHSFAPFWNPLAKNGEKKGLAKTTPKKEENSFAPFSNLNFFR